MIVTVPPTTTLVDVVTEKLVVVEVEVSVAVPPDRVIVEVIVVVVAEPDPVDEFAAVLLPIAPT